MQAVVGQECPLRSRAPADETTRRSGGDHQSRGAGGGSHRRGYRHRRAGRDPASGAVGSASGGGQTGSDPVRANGWDGNTGSEERDGGPARQDAKVSHPTPGRSSWDVSSPRPPGTRRVIRFAIRIPPPTPVPSKPPKSLASASMLEAWKRGWSRAEKKVVMGDGAEWIWNLAEPHFPGAVQIVDLFHARQHLWDLARKLYPNDDVNQKTWIKVHQRRLLDKGKIEKLVLSASFHRLQQSRSGREDSHRGRLL